LSALWPIQTAVALAWKRPPPLMMQLSTTLKPVLKALLARWPDHPRVDQITTDGFLWPNAELERRQIMDRKGFPDSFDTASLLNFLASVKSGMKRVEAPVYSHFRYDILADQKAVIVAMPFMLTAAR